MSFRLGDTIGQYKMLKSIGSGGMATVYLAEHPRLERQVAIKIMHEAFSRDADFLARFEREAQIVAGLDHSHIVPVYDYSDFDGQPYLVMKYVEGKSLKRLINENPLPSITEILRVLDPIADALTYAHEHGILHRDIKPSNILLDTANVPYLADFGLARIAMAGESTMSQDIIVGTPAYISPEQARGDRVIDGRADLYSLGIIIYQLLVGEVPFAAETPIAIIHDQIYRPLPKPSAINPDITPTVEAVLLKALAKKPSARYGTANEMMQALRQAAQQDGLDVLNPAHLDSAAESIALYREREDEAASVATPSAPRTVVDRSSVTTEYRFRHGWIWALFGFVFTVLLLGFTIANLAATDESVQVLYRELQATAVVAEQQQYIATLPDLSLDQAQRVIEIQPENIAAYLSAARTFWQAGSPQDAETALQLASERTASPLDLWLTAAGVAAQNDQHLEAIEYGFAAVDEAEGTERYNTVRNQVGAAAYQIASTPELLTARDVRTLDVPFVRIRSLITQGELETVAAAVDEEAVAAPEMLLVVGDYYAAIGDTDKAFDFWENAADASDNIIWIKALVEQREID